MNLRRGQRNAFSLVELLVVIAILSLLTGMLLPTIHRMLDMARRTVCGNNIRNLYVANTGYAAEHAQQYCLAAADVFGANLQRWHGKRDDVNDPFEPERGALREFLGSWPKACPDLRDVFSSSGQNGAGFEAGCGGYGYNASYIGGRYDAYSVRPDEHSAGVDEIANPSRTVMFTDAAYAQNVSGSTTLIEYSFCEPPNHVPYGGRPDPTLHFRHGGKAVVVWVDGSVSNETLSFSGAYQTGAQISAAEAEEMGLGWFGPDSNELFDLE